MPSGQLQFGTGIALGRSMGSALTLGQAGGAYHVKARALLAAIAAAPTIGAVAGNDVPTITEGSNFGTSSLTGIGFGNTGATVGMLDATLTTLGNRLVVNGSLPYCVTEDRISTDGLKGGGAGWGVRFRTPSVNAFDIGIYQNTVRAKINGAWSSPFTATQPTWVKYAFPTTAQRDVELRFAAGSVLAGINFASGTATALPSTFPRAAVFGDSWDYADYPAAIASASKPVGGFVPKLAESLGLLDVAILGFNGQGAVFPDPTYSKTLLQRAQAGEFSRYPNVDLLILYNSINDYGQTAATVQANWSTITSLAMAALPNAIIWGFTGFKTSNNNVDAAHNSAFINGFNAVKNPARMGVWDGNNQIITVGGNDATYIAADGLHPTDAGSIYVPTVLKPQLVSFLNTI